MIFYGGILTAAEVIPAKSITNATNTATMGSYDLTSGTYALWHSENAYCDPNSYLSRHNRGIVTAFWIVISWPLTGTGS